MNQVYISYSSWDKPAAEAVCASLESAGIACFLVPRDLPQGEDPTSARLAALRESPFFVLILSSRYESSPRLVEELDAASRSDCHIIPMLVEDFSPGAALNYYLRSLHWLDAVHSPLADSARTLAANILQTLKMSGAALPSAPAPAPQPSPPAPLYDVFISYRRETDSQTARLLRSELSQRHFRVFLDVDDLRPGHFDESLLEHIRTAPAFLVILSPGSLDRCTHPEDWLRREVACAIANQRTIIPVLMPHFQFPPGEALPVELHPLRTHHGVSYSHEFFAAMLEKIVSYLRQP